MSNKTAEKEMQMPTYLFPASVSRFNMHLVNKMQEFLSPDGWRKNQYQQVVTKSQVTKKMVTDALLYMTQINNKRFVDVLGHIKSTKKKYQELMENHERKMKELKKISWFKRPHNLIRIEKIEIERCEARKLVCDELIKYFSNLQSLDYYEQTALPVDNS
jgi:hypothetical protein